MATKTWKLGEVCNGGIITVETSETKINVIIKEWDFSMGSTRSSNQSKAKELYRKEVSFDNSEAYNEVMNFLYEQTTSYHSDKVMAWIQENVTFKSGFTW